MAEESISAEKIENNKKEILDLESFLQKVIEKLHVAVACHSTNKNMKIMII